MTQKNRESDESIEKIENAALRLFSKQGYSNTSLEEVASFAGFTKGAIYYHFNKKENLLLHVIQKIEARSIQRTSREVRATNVDAIQQLVKFVQMQAHWGSQYPDDLVLLIQASLEFYSKDSPVKQAILHYYDVMENLVEEIIVRGIEEGSIPSDTDVRAVVLTNIARHDGNMLLWHRSGLDPQVGRVLTAAACDSVRRLGKVTV